MTKRAFSTLQIKSVNADSRIIKGIASTPSPDRMEDIVEPKGAQFSLPLPFLWQHDQKQPIGHVIKADITDAGIEVEVQIASTETPGKLKDRLDEAWDSIKAGLVRGMSIGFKPIETANIENSWGLRFLRWDWFELSAVTIPANADASITSVKSFALQQGAALGKSLPVVRFAKPAGATATPSTKPTGDDMSLQEKLKALQEARKAKAFQAKEMMEGDGGETLDEAGQVTFDKLDAEVKSLDAEIKRVERAIELDMTTAKPVAKTSYPHTDKGIEIGQFDPVVKAPMLKDGLGMAQYVKIIGLAKGNRQDAMEIARAIDGVDPRVIEALKVNKAAIGAATTTGATWASPLVQPGGLFADFLEYLRPQTLVGQFGTGNIPSLRNVLFNMPLLAQTSAGSAYWVGEAKAKPLTKWDYTDTSLLPKKVATIAVLTDELIRRSAPQATVLVRNELLAAARERIDIDFINPANAATATRPASILNGVAPITASGTDADALNADLLALDDAFIAANNPPASGVYIMDAMTAAGIGRILNPLNNLPLYPNIGPNGGPLNNRPALVSNYVPRDSGGGILALVNADDIYFADEGDFDVAMSNEASLEMSDAPTGASDTPTGSSLVSMWQTNSTAFRVERSLNWMRRRAVSVAWIQDTMYGRG